MSTSNNSSATPSRTSTPNPTTSSSRFTSQASTAEDLLKSQTVGLVHLSDFRKRRAEALEQKEREAQDRSLGRFTPGSRSGAATPSDGASTPQRITKKPRKSVAKGKLSFGIDYEEESELTDSRAQPPSSNSPRNGTDEKVSPRPEAIEIIAKKRMGPNANVTITPKAITKSALLREAQTREQLRKEFILLQEAVKSTEILIPFVFYDGTNIPGGICKVKKGDFIWLFLDRSRKVGAELGVGATGEKANSRREWARVGVDDLMLVRGEIIIPHHYEFYYFLINKTLSPSGLPLFPYTAQPSPLTATITASSSYDPLSHPSSSTKKPSVNITTLSPSDMLLEGHRDDPNLTKVVDRRWYERNKHIFPASVWEEFDPGKDYTKGMRRDGEGNAFFFS